MADKLVLLIVDDDPGMRSQLKWGLDKYNVYTAGNRKDALEQFNEHHPQVVTLDLGLPPFPEGIQEGLATLRQILKWSPETKVIVVSGATQSNCAQKAVESGAYEFHPKPVDMKKLSKIVENAYHSYK